MPITPMSTAPAVSSEPGPAKPAFSTKSLIGLVLGPVLAIAIWVAPLSLDPKAKHAMAITALMVIYWALEPIDHGLTALLGCYLFWALGIVKFETAFAGFTDNTPWFLFGAMLMGEAASRSGLAHRIGYGVMRVIGTSYRRLLFSMITFVLILNFLVPSGLAQITIVGPIAVGIVAAFGLEAGSNIGRGMFVIITYCLS